jgi:hypothetical protein
MPNFGRTKVGRIVAANKSVANKSGATLLVKLGIKMCLTYGTYD